MNNNIYNNNLRKEIISKADIVSIIGSYVKLEKKGANYIGLCPFHDDKNPSMSVSPTKRVFKCFSCNTGGDVVTFVSKIKNISQRDAMREIGKDLGISVSVSKKEIERQKNDKYYRLMKDASDFYSFFLSHADEAKEAIKYLHDRGLNDDVIKAFNIGLSSDNDEIYKLLLSKNYLPLDMIEVGLVSSFKDTYKDTFRNRIIFPITDLDGNICGFSGRKYLKGDENSKYMNTSETIIFKKGQILYNYHNALNKIKEEKCVFLFEGFMDVIAAVRANVLNSIASMGTALTNDQIDAIKKVCSKVVVCYDSDEPGINATLRAIEMLAEKGLDINVVTIPDGKDSDEYIKKNGSEALNDYLLHHQVSAMDFVFNLFSKNLTNDLSLREQFKNTIFKYLKLFSSSLIIETFIEKLSNTLNVSKDALNSDFEKFKKNDKKFIRKYNEIEVNSDLDEVFSNLNKNDSKNTKTRQDYFRCLCLKAERKLIYASFISKSQCDEISSKLSLSFVLNTNRDILFKLYEYYRKREVLSKDEFYEKLDDNEKIVLDDILKNEKEDNFDYVLDCINLVLKYPAYKAINDEKNNGTKKTIDDIKKLADNKKAVTKITKKRG